jgi:HEAT repeat protein
MFRPPPLPRTLDAALRDITSAKAAVRAEAARDLVAHASDEGARDRVVGALEGALRDKDGSVRAAAAVSLADSEAREALPALLVAVEDEDPMVRQMAITALGEIGDPRATERLRRALSDERPEVRFQAVIAFPRVIARREGARDALLDATRDPDPLVCHIALRMIEELATKLDEQGEEHGVAEEALARARELLKHADGAVRVAAAILLGRAGEEVGRDLLVEVAKGDLATSEGDDEAAAIELCGELGLTAARPGLERRAFGGVLGIGRDRFAWHARVALARMGHERATREILRELDSWDRDRRTLAVAAVGRARLAAARGLVEAMRGDESRADAGAVAEALAALARPEAR